MANAKKPNQLSLIEVTWVDADINGGWHTHDPKKDDELEYLRSYGLLVSKGKNYLTISHAFNKGSADWLGKHRIPLKWIKEIKVIKNVPL